MATKAEESGQADDTLLPQQPPDYNDGQGQQAPMLAQYPDQPVAMQVQQPVQPMIMQPQMQYQPVQYVAQPVQHVAQPVQHVAQPQYAVAGQNMQPRVNPEITHCTLRSIKMWCQGCQKEINTDTKRVFGGTAKKYSTIALITGLVCMGGTLGLIPFICMLNQFHDVIHSCPRCKVTLGMYDSRKELF